jgi:hypothetical protein
MVKIRELTIWSGEVANRPGMLARALAPLAEAGADLEVVMAYLKPGDRQRAVLEVAPISGVREQAAAREADLHPAEIPCLLVEGTNRPGLGHEIAKALGDDGIDMNFLVTHVVGEKYRSVIGFASGESLERAAAAIRRASGAGARGTARAASARKRPAAGAKGAAARKRTAARKGSGSTRKRSGSTRKRTTTRKAARKRTGSAR